MYSIYCCKCIITHVFAYICVLSIVQSSSSGMFTSGEHIHMYTTVHVHVVYNGYCDYCLISLAQSLGTIWRMIQHQDQTRIGVLSSLISLWYIVILTSLLHTSPLPHGIYTCTLTCTCTCTCLCCYLIALLFHYSSELWPHPLDHQKLAPEKLDNNVSKRTSIHCICTLYMCNCICICMYMCIHVYMYVYMCIHVHVHACKVCCTFTCTILCTCIWVYILLKVVHFLAAAVINIPPGMVQDQFGMMGLLTFIRGAETDPSLVALALGRSALDECGLTYCTCCMCGIALLQWPDDSWTEPQFSWVSQSLCGLMFMMCFC